MATPSVHREIERAERAGLVISRRVGNTRIVRADIDSPYFEDLASLLTNAFGIPQLLAHAFADVDGIERALIFGSWAARPAGQGRSTPTRDDQIGSGPTAPSEGVSLSLERSVGDIGRDPMGSLDGRDAVAEEQDDGVGGGPVGVVGRGERRLPVLGIEKYIDRSHPLPGAIKAGASRRR